MSKFISNYETLTSVLTSLQASSGTFDHRELSGRPEFTGGNTYTTLACGFSGSRTFEGYNFDSLDYLMLSASGSTYASKTFTISAYDADSGSHGSYTPPGTFEVIAETGGTITHTVLGGLHDYNFFWFTQGDGTWGLNTEQSPLTTIKVTLSTDDASAAWDNAIAAGSHIEPSTDGSIISSRMVTAINRHSFLSSFMTATSELSSFTITYDIKGITGNSLEIQILDDLAPGEHDDGQLPLGKLGGGSEQLLDVFTLGHGLSDYTTGVSAVSDLPFASDTGSGNLLFSPSISGFFLTTGTSAGTYTLNTYNSMSVAFPELTATGIIDIVPINAAGFTTLANDINTTITIN